MPATSVKSLNACMFSEIATTGFVVEAIVNPADGGSSFGIRVGLKSQHLAKSVEIKRSHTFNGTTS